MVEYRIYKTCLKIVYGISSTLVLSMWRLPRLSLVFWGYFFGLRILSCIMTILVAVEIGDMTQIFVNRIGYIEGINIGGWNRIFLGSLIT